MFAKFLLTLLLSLSAFLFASCGDTPSNNNSNSEDAPINADDEIKNNDDEDKSGDKGENVPSGGSNDDDGEDKDKGEDSLSPHVEPLAIESSATSVPAYSGNLYTAVYYAPSLSTLSLDANGNYNISSGRKESFKISGTYAPKTNASSLYSPFFFSKYEEKDLIDPDFLARLDAKREADNFFLSSPMPLNVEERDSGAINPQAFLKTAPISIGSTWSNVKVFKNGGGNGSQTNVTATCKYISQKAYFYVDNTVASSVDNNILKEIGDAFDKDYDKFTAIYGEPGDIDHNGKVIFLFTNLSQQNLMGFFYSADQHPASTNFSNGVKSNEADVLYMNSYYANSARWNSEKERDHLVGTLFHELQHMVIYNNRLNNLNIGNQKAVFFPKWINEGLSMLSEYIAGHALAHSDYIRNFLAANMHNSIISNNNIEYGYNLLFFRYLYERFGKDIDIIKGFYNSTSIKEDELFLEVFNIPFEELYADFVKMVLMTGRYVTSDPKYNITAFNHPVNSTGYKKNGFNLVDDMNVAISYHLNQPYNNMIYNFGVSKTPSLYSTNTGYSVTNASPYSFYITRWTQNTGTISLNNNKLKGFFITTDAGY